QLTLRGAVLVSIRGSRPGEVAASDDDAASAQAIRLSKELTAALREPPLRPWRHLVGLLRVDGLLTPLMLLIAFAVAAGGVVLQALLLRGLFDLGHELRVPWQRLAAMGALISFIGLMLLLEMPITAILLRIGRKLEMRLRMSFFEKIPRLGDRYFQSRPI